MKIQQSLFGAALSLALAAFVGCSGSTTTTDTSTGGPATEDGKAVSSVEITPDKDTLSKDTTTKFRAIVRYADGTTKDITDARVLALLGDSVTTDHISPAGNIKRDSPAGKWLQEHGVSQGDFNSYGSRRGNHEIMIRGTFANIRLRNQGHTVARSQSGARGQLRAHPPLKPHRNGCASSAVPAR